jgi:hypothetical protein
VTNIPNNYCKYCGEYVPAYERREHLEKYHDIVPKQGHPLEHYGGKPVPEEIITERALAK